MKQKLILPVVAILMSASVWLGVQYVSAFAGPAAAGDHQALVQQLAEQFGLEESEVEAFFDQHREERQSEMQARFQERLDQAVADGKLTQAQQEAVLAKHAELHELRESYRDEWQSMSQEERQATRQAHRDELRQWAQENGIELGYLMGQPRGGQGRQ